MRDWVANVLVDPAVDPVMVGGPGFADLVSLERATISHLFSAGGRVAAHVVCHGRYRGGFADVDATRIGTSVVLRLATMIDVVGGMVVRAQVSGDRLGLHRQLSSKVPPPPAGTEVAPVFRTG